jgi:hypothetical protein
VLYHSGDGDVPSAWQFRDSPAHTDADYEYDGWPDSEIYDLVVAYGSVDSDDLRAFGNVMARYLDILRMAGKDY